MDLQLDGEFADRGKADDLGLNRRPTTEALLQRGSKPHLDPPIGELKRIEGPSELGLDDSSLILAEVSFEPGRFASTGRLGLAEEQDEAIPCGRLDAQHAGMNDVVAFHMLAQRRQEVLKRDGGGGRRDGTVPCERLAAAVLDKRARR